MAKMIKRYYEYLKRGDCPACGGPRDADGFLCLKCLVGNRRRGALISRALRTKYNMDYRRRNRRAGLCPRCGKPTSPGLIHCRFCLDKTTERRKLTAKGGL